MFKVLSKTLVLGLVVLVASLYAAGDKIVAIVGDSVILQSELDAVVTAQMEASGNSGDMLLRNLTEQKVKKDMIDQLVMTIYALNDTNLTITEDKIQSQVEKRIGMIISQNNISMEQLKQSLKAEYGITIDEYRDRLYAQMKQQTITQAIQGFYLYGTELSRKEVETFYNSYKDSIPTAGPSIRFQKLELAVGVSAEERQKVFDEIMAIREKVVTEGKDFTEVAKSSSKGMNAASGGDLGYITKGTLALIKLEKALFRLNPGQVSSPVETKLGYHLLTVTEKRENQVKAQQIFLPLNKDDKRLKEVAFIIDSLKAHVKSDEDFAKAVKEFSDDAVSKTYEGKTDWMSVAELEADLKSKIPAEVTKGEFLTEFSTDKAMFLYRVYDYDADRKLTLESDYERLKSIATQFSFNEKMQELVAKWREKIFVKEM